MADGAPLSFHKVTVMPPAPVADGMYFVRPAPGSPMRIAVTTASGEVVDLQREVLQLTFGSTGKPAAGAEFGRYLVLETMDVSEIGLAIAEAAAAAQTDLLVKRGVDTVARYRWDAGAIEADLLVLIPTVNRGDLLILTAPLVQDATLAGISGTFALLRRN